MNRNRILAAVALLSLFAGAFLLMGRVSTGSPVPTAPIPTVEVGGPAAALPHTPPPARTEPAEPVEPVVPVLQRDVPVAAEDTDDAADGRLIGPDDAITYTLDGIGVQAAFEDVSDLREACLDELPTAPLTPDTVSATIQLVELDGEGRVENIYLPVVRDEDGPLIACLARSMATAHFERPRRKRISLTGSWTLRAP